jgi:RimJ/RimL family protein N-acetyltransferase
MEKGVSYILRPVDEAGARASLTWRYEPPYDIYNTAEGAAEEVVAYLLDPAIRCHAITGESGELLGLATFGHDGQVPGGDYGREALDIGMAIRPDHTGRGLGRHFVAAVLAFAAAQFRPPAFRVTIAAFNRRAQRVWEQNGFRPVQRFRRPGDGLAFVVYEKEAAP